MSANTWALTLILHRTQRVADEAINRALDCSLVLPAFRFQKSLMLTCSAVRAARLCRHQLLPIALRAFISASSPFPINQRMASEREGLSGSVLRQ
jgi:hypothetical protein